MNYDKTVAFSVSGIPHPHWLPTLAFYGITQWHNRLSVESLIYLGYPLMHSNAHHNWFQSHLIAKISRACDIHKQCDLSIQGRATVLNTLILFTLWYVLRVTWVSQTTLGNIRRIGRKIQMFRVFPPITSDILHLPLQQGGIGALDPTIQQQALQFRWLTPLFQHHYPLHLAAKWIGAHISSIAPIALFDHRLPFLFKVLRRNMLQQHHPGVCAILFRAFDGLYDSSTISGVLNIDLNTPDIFPLNLSLDLPVSSVIQYINDFCRKEQNSFGNILIRYVFEYVPVLDCLRRKVLPTERPNITFGRYQVQKLLCWITSNPLFKILVDPDVDPILQLISSKRFRQASLIKLLQTIPLSSPVRQNWYIFGNSFGVHKFLLPFEHRDTHA
ncbi:hypothetical protein G6F47_012877 [Rhizopus delemar]|nr:hypothetical protein G6F53_012746 [Rhizopus delemar]KAG1578617.1 hypothetical protein G6F47_012877 [Rhizopus delemar]